MATTNITTTRTSVTIPWHRIGVSDHDVERNLEAVKGLLGFAVGYNANDRRKPRR